MLSFQSRYTSRRDAAVHALSQATVAGRRIVDRALQIAERARSEGAIAMVDRLIDTSRAYVLFRATEMESRVMATGHVVVRADGRIAIGALSLFAGGMIPTSIVCHAGAELLIGERNDWNYGVIVEARRSVRIGRRVVLGSMVRIEDTLDGRTAPIVIGDDVWIAHGAIIEPGVTIGDGAVVSAGSVVTRDVPPGRLAMGRPARALPMRASSARAGG